MILYVVDPTRAIGNEEHQALAMIESVKVPKIMIINKIDEEIKPFLENYRDLAKQFDGLAEISALRGSHLKDLITVLFELLPEGEAFYPALQ